MADLSKIKLNGTTYNFKDAAARQSISNITNFNVLVVNTLPTTNIDTHTIYFISNNGSNNNNIYDEYMYIGSAWEKIGTTDIDLSNYLQTSDIASWAKATNKPSYTASEVGALPDTYTAPVSSVNELTGAVVLTASDIGATTPYEITSGVGYSGSSSAFDIYLSNYYGNYTYTNFMIFVNRSHHINSTFLVYTLTNSMDNHLEISRSNLTINGVNSPTEINSGLYYGTMSAWSTNATITLVSAPKMTDIQTATAISNTLSSGTLIATINGTNIYAPAAYDDTALAARVTALENIPWVTYYTGSSTPSNSQGNNGDLYFQTAQ